MSISKQDEDRLISLCKTFRIKLIDILYNAQTGHPGGSLSATEIITSLYNEIMSIDKDNIDSPDRDRFVLSKGHAVPMLYINLAYKGIIDEDELNKFRQIGSRLQGHPCQHKTPGIDVSTGSLGLGLSVGLGIALSGVLNRSKYKTYVLMGDGEIQEGCVWEAAMCASKYKLNNLIAIIDNNGVQLDGTNEEIMPLGDIEAKFKGFGWNVIKCNGNDVMDFCNAVDQAKLSKDKPNCIIASTIKGKGVSFMQGKSEWHGKAINKQEHEWAINELNGGSYNA